MKREILFKAKHIHALPENEWMEGKWVEGFLSGEDYINDGTYEYMIDPDTICQYTGLTDKKGRKIWENDIIKYHYGDYYAPVKFGEYQSCFDSTTTCHVGFYVDWDEKRDFRKDLGYWIKMVDAEVVGNIHDKSEQQKDSQINGNLSRFMSGMHMQRSFWSRSRELIRQQRCIIPRQVSGSMNRENRIRLWRGCCSRKGIKDNGRR